MSEKECPEQLDLEEQESVIRSIRRRVSDLQERMMLDREEVDYWLKRLKITGHNE